MPIGLTHREADPCPFEKDRFPQTDLGNCCTLYAEPAYLELKALGLRDLAADMRDPISAEDAIGLASMLRKAVRGQEVEYSEKDVKPHGRGIAGHVDDASGQFVWTRFTTFEDALACIRQAADWYEKVGTLGFGVNALR